MYSCNTIFYCNLWKIKKPLQSLHTAADRPCWGLPITAPSSLPLGVNVKTAGPHTVPHICPRTTWPFWIFRSLNEQVTSPSCQGPWPLPQNQPPPHHGKAQAGSYTIYLTDLLLGPGLQGMDGSSPTSWASGLTWLILTQQQESS